MPWLSTSASNIVTLLTLDDFSEGYGDVRTLGLVAFRQMEEWLANPSLMEADSRC